MVVISEPRKVLVGEGKNAKYVKECKEMYLGNKGIEKIRGFEDFVNLECLCMNSNKLKKINNLDTCTRMKVLYAQDNQICTLRGSLHTFKFLEQLDLSNNQLRDLAKLIPVLQRFQFLAHLNLKGNPCCEEPDYRLQLVHAIPNLIVLDQHVIASSERMKAKANIGGDVQALTVAFGKRAPARDPAFDERHTERSILELELAKEAAQVRDTKLIREQNKELLQYCHNPHPDIPRGSTLPPNAGMRKAMDTWREVSDDGPGSGSAFSTFSGEALDRRRTSQGAEANTSTAKKDTADGAYKPRDTFVLYSSRTRPTELLSSSGGYRGLGMGTIEFEDKKYESFITRKLAGTLGQWDIERKTTRV